MSIAIYPGTFNPIHIAHLIIAETARTTFNLSKVIFITSNIPPHRINKIADPIHRYKMVDLACKNNPHFEASDMEIIRKGTSYTYETIQEIAMKYAIDDNINFLIGTDAFCQLHTWKHAQKIVNKCRFLVIDRPFCSSAEDYIEYSTLNNIKYEKLSAPQMDISSTMIRNRNSAGLSIKYLVIDDVLNYIHQNALYNFCDKEIEE